MLNLLLITLGVAWLTELAGLSLALGAFVAGMLISETEYKHQVETDIRPFHDVLLGLFFITIGMLLDWRLVVERWGLVLLLLACRCRSSLALVTLLARLLGASRGVAAHRPVPGAGRRIRLCAADSGPGQSLVPTTLLNPVLASMVLSMLATPFIIMYSNRIVMKLVASEWLQQSLQMTTIARKIDQRQQARDHLRLRALRPEPGAHAEREGIPYLALDLDPDRVRQAAAAGDSVVFGDAARLQALVAAGLARASAVVVTYLDVHGA